MEPPHTHEAIGEHPGGTSGKRWVIIGVAAGLVLGGGGFAAYVLKSGLLKSNSGALAEDNGYDTSKPANAPVVADTYYDMPEMLVNLNAPRHTNVFLKLQVTLDLASADDVDPVENALPRIMDAFQSCLREKRVSELAGTAGMSTLRDILLRRANMEVGANLVKDVLFKQMIVQ